MIFIIQDKLSNTKHLEELKSENKNINKIKIGSLTWRHICKQLLAVLTRQDTEPVTKYTYRNWIELPEQLETTLDIINMVNKLKQLEWNNKFKSLKSRV